MKNICILCIILFINIIYAKNITAIINNYPKVNPNKSKSKDDYYLIYVNNDYEELHIYSDLNINKRQESNIFIESLIDEIKVLISNNRNTYQHPEILDEIEKKNQLKKKDNNQLLSTFDNSDIVYPISSTKNRVVLYTYLSENLVKEIKSINEVIDCVPDSVSINTNSYSREDILMDTNWKNLSIQENADFHLSLLSQGKYDENLIGEYDNNYYYPASAGEGIDIVILDSSFNFDNSEFSNTDERIVKCAANIKNGKADLSNIDNYCGDGGIFFHGETVSDIAGGLKHGAAKRANIYGVSLPVDYHKRIQDSDILGGLQFIYEKMIRPHKTVINLSLGGSYDRSDPFVEQMESLTNSITLKGGIIVTAAGNGGINLNTISKYTLPCIFKNVICVGGIANYQKKSSENIYKIDVDSNYGDDVNFYAPYRVEAEIIRFNIFKKVVETGTSFSSPLVAGIIATIMSENPDIEYTTEIITKILNDNGNSETFKIYNTDSILANNGKHIVYSENDIYYGCGIHSGNRPYSSDIPDSNSSDISNPSSLIKIISATATNPSTATSITTTTSTSSTVITTTTNATLTKKTTKKSISTKKTKKITTKKVVTIKKKITTKKTVTSGIKSTSKKITSKNTTSKNTTTKKTTTKKI